MVNSQLVRASPSYADRFFALNAVRFLGLSKYERSRSRLDSFYQKTEWIRRQIRRNV